MLQKYIAKFIALVFIIIFAASVSLSQSRINFKRGQSSATVGARIQANGSRQYVVRASAGQTITLRLISSTGNITVSTRAHSPGTEFSYQLEQDGDVNLFVENAGAGAQYKLTVTIR